MKFCINGSLHLTRVYISKFFGQKGKYIYDKSIIHSDMKFLVKWCLMPMPPEMMKTALAVIPAEIEYGKALKEKGKLLAMYTFAGKSEGFGIMDVKSHEELNDILAKDPASMMVSFEAIPIVDFEYSLKVWKEVLERAVK